MSATPPLAPLARPPLLIDDRESPELVKSLQCFDLPIHVRRLEFGDICFPGSGPGDQPVYIGFERKRLADLISSMHDRRLQSFQRVGMSESYDFLYLIVEGLWRPSSSGGIEEYVGSTWRPLYHNRSGVEFKQVDGFLDSMELRGGMLTIRSATTSETARIISNRYERWQKAWSSHHSHDDIYAPDPTAQFAGRARVYNRKAGYLERFISILPHCDRRSWDVAKHFKSIREAANADEREWMRALEIKKGRTIVRDIARVLRGEINGDD